MTTKTRNYELVKTTGEVSAYGIGEEVEFYGHLLFFDDDDTGYYITEKGNLVIEPHLIWGPVDEMLVGLPGAIRQRIEGALGMDVTPTRLDI